MADESRATPAVSDAMEQADEQSDDASSTDTQAGAEQRERISLRRLIREDPDVNAEFQRELARARRRWQRSNLRGAAAEVVQAADKDAALRIAHAVAIDEDDDDEDGTDGSLSPVALEKFERVQPFLTRLLRIDASGNATNPYYARVFNEVGQTEIDRRFAQDPEAFYDWIEDKIQDARAEDRAKKIAPSLADAVATDRANQQLRRMPTALSGGSTGSALTLDSWESMTFEERQQIREKNPKLIDDMVARAQRR